MRRIETPAWSGPLEGTGTQPRQEREAGRKPDPAGWRKVRPGSEHQRALLQTAGSTHIGCELQEHKNKTNETNPPLPKRKKETNKKPPN